MSQGIVSGIVNNVIGPRAGEFEIGAGKRSPADLKGVSGFTYSPPPGLWSGITPPLVMALLNAIPTCDEADKLSFEAADLLGDAMASQTETEREKLNGEAAERFKAAAAKYKECNNPGHEASMLNWYRETYFSTNKVGFEEQSKVYRMEAEAFVRASNSATDVSQKIKYLWKAGEAQMRISEGEVVAANGFFDKAYELSLTLKELKYEHAADGRHYQSQALSRAATQFDRADLRDLSDKAERESKELTAKAQEGKKKKDL